MSQRRSAPPALVLASPSRPRSPWQLFYGAIHGARRRYWRRRAARLPRPVVSVGNLCFGGGGKTPLVAAIAAHLRDQGHHVAILSRGYKSRGQGVRVVSRGEGPLLGPRTAGDEPVLLAGTLPGVAVVVAPDRRKAAAHALARLDPAPDIFLLDDGFSHVKLHRDIDLLAFPAADPFAGGRLPPGGRLREPLASAAHAHAVLLTGGRDPSAGEALASALRPYGFEGPGFLSRTRPQPPQWVTGTPDEPALASGTPVLAVSAIARPGLFRDTVIEAGLEVVEHLVYSDHHDYPDATLQTINRSFADHAAEAVVVTSKDRVKLQGKLDLPMAEIPIRADLDRAFFAWLDNRLAEILDPDRPPEPAR